MGGMSRKELQKRNPDSEKTNKICNKQTNFMLEIVTFAFVFYVAYSNVSNANFSDKYKCTYIPA